MIEDVNKFGIITTDQEKSQRLSMCNSCEKNIEFQGSNLCIACACPIHYVITYKFKKCPVNKWSIE
jgi:hypothetical protein